jgi:hypothetical protein
VTSTRDFEAAQPEEGIVATQLDVLAREQEENEGSSSEKCTRVLIKLKVTTFNLIKSRMQQSG